jgi:hypothetical protein
MHSQGHALFFVKNGYQTFFGHHDINMLDSVIENCTEADIQKLERHLETLRETEADTYRFRKLALDIAFIKAGGSYAVQLPTLSSIESFLLQGIPVVCGIKNKAAHLLPNGSEGNHSVIITGKDGEFFFINDPSPR